MKEGAPAPEEERADRRARLAGAVLIILCASLLAWLGPLWGIPLGLVLFGVVLLAGLSASSLCYPGEPGAFSPRWLLLFPVLAAFLGAGLFCDWRTVSSKLVLIERFVPRSGTAAPVGFEFSELSSRTVFLEYAVTEPAARRRLGYLLGYGRALSEKESARISRELLFVNEVLLTERDLRSESLQETVRRVLETEDSFDSRVIELRRAKDGSVKIVFEGPGGLFFEILLLRQVEGVRRRFTVNDVIEVAFEKKPLSGEKARYLLSPHGHVEGTFLLLCRRGRVLSEVKFCETP